MHIFKKSGLLSLQVGVAREMNDPGNEIWVETGQYQQDVDTVIIAKIYHCVCQYCKKKIQ